MYKEIWCREDLKYSSKLFKIKNEEQLNFVKNNRKFIYSENLDNIIFDFEYIVMIQEDDYSLTYYIIKIDPNLLSKEQLIDRLGGKK